MKDTKKSSHSNGNKTKKNKHINGHIIDRKQGWITLHIFGDPFERGFAHGALLYQELKDVLHAFPFILKENVQMSLAKFIRTSNRIIKPVLRNQFPEFYKEIEGIAVGSTSKGTAISIDFLIAWNAFLSLYSYYKDGKSTERCSAFIACGDATENRDIIMAHNTHSDFVSGQLLNIVLYITPTDGVPFVMQTSSGFIASTSDWFLTSNGLIGCETTISDIRYKPKFGTPYFCRIRQAMQYGKTMDHFVEIMTEQNAGDYACSWLVGDIRSKEIMLFELGLRKHNIQRTKNGIFYGMNSAIGEELRTKETNDQSIFDISTSSGARNKRMHDLLFDQYYGKITMDTAKVIMSDHYDVFLNKELKNSRGICKHTELDSHPPTNKPYYLFGCTDSKIVTTDMASKLSFLGRFGSSCGTPFIVDDFIENHPEYKKWAPFLHDIPRNQWTTLRLTRK